MAEPHDTPRLTLAQQAAVARVAYAAERPAAIVLVCGPAGVGKTLVLGRVAVARPLESRSPALTTPESAGSLLSRPEPDAVPGILLVDDAHLAGERQLAELLAGYRERRPEAAVVLTGEGRLLSIVSRDSRLEQAVVLRAALPPFTLDETRMMVAEKLVAAGSVDERDSVARTIHEIAAGIPAMVRRLADLAALLAAADPGRKLVPDDIETIHRRLSLQAA
jgi:type II secretory pathway predicted ATPase ExeA